jgi:hypothetical protein
MSHNYRAISKCYPKSDATIPTFVPTACTLLAMTFEDSDPCLAINGEYPDECGQSAFPKHLGNHWICNSNS